MIKVRCPADRLTDVAEVLRLKLKTRDGKLCCPCNDIHLDRIDLTGYFSSVSRLLCAFPRELSFNLSTTQRYIGHATIAWPSCFSVQVVRKANDY